MIKAEVKVQSEVKSVVVGKWQYTHPHWICPECGTDNSNSICRKCFRSKSGKEI